MSKSLPLRWILVDGDMFIYRAGFSCESKGVAIKSLAVAKWRIKKMILDTIKIITEKYPKVNWSTNIYITATDGSNFRYKIDPDYKKKRKTLKKPIYYQQLREYIESNLFAEVVQGAEADDAMGMRMAKGNIGVSNDKDLLTIPGLWYNPVKKVWHNITEQQAEFNFYTQLLMGDAADSIFGLTGIGPIKAKRILSQTLFGGMNDKYLQCLLEYWCMYGIVSTLSKDKEGIDNNRDWRVWEKGLELAQTIMHRNGNLLWISRNKLGEPWPAPPVSNKELESLREILDKRLTALINSEKRKLKKSRSQH